MILTFPGDIPLDLLLYRAFRREVQGLVDATLASNPGLADLGPLPPRGTTVVVVPPAQGAGVTLRKLIRLTGT